MEGGSGFVFEGFTFLVMWGCFLVEIEKEGVGKGVEEGEWG